MIELTNTVIQTVEPNATATLNATVFRSGRDVCHRCGSGLVQLEGRGTSCNPAKYRVAVSGNIGGGAGTQANVAIAVNGETLTETIRTATITAATDVFPFSAMTNVRECGSCCDTISVKNVGTTPITLSNLSFIVGRIG